jgi:hypothetical protein
MLLAVLGRWRAPLASTERDVRGYALGAAALLLPALASPLEVRYLLALGPAVAILAADGARRLAVRRPGGALVSTVLVCGQLVLAARNLLEAVLERYR